jgi:uncharacterized membrane protein
MRRMVRKETLLERAVFRWCGLAVTAGAGAGLWYVWRVAGLGGLGELGSAALTSLLFLGKFVIFLGLRSGSLLSPWTMALMVWVIDVLLAFALASGLENLERAPLLGRWLRRARQRAILILAEYPGLERMAFLGVMAFVLLPLAATGAISGSFAARIVGLRRIPGILAITLGSAATAFGFALLASFLGERAEELAGSPVLIGGILLTLAILGRAAWVRVTNKLKES